MCAAPRGFGRSAPWLRTLSALRRRPCGGGRGAMTHNPPHARGSRNGGVGCVVAIAGVGVGAAAVAGAAGAAVVVFAAAGGAAGAVGVARLVVGVSVSAGEVAGLPLPLRLPPYLGPALVSAPSPPCRVVHARVGGKHGVVRGWRRG